jgi:hypothetical protein
VVNVRYEGSVEEIRVAFLTMSIRYWIAAIVFGLAALAVDPQYVWAQGQTQPAQVHVTVPLPAFGLIDQSPEPDQLTNPCEPGKDNRNSDLCAQWKAADAADKSANLARPTFRLGILGAVVGAFTLIAAVSAAIFAKSAANATWKTVEVTREIGIAQTRSYISVVGGEFTLNNGGYSGSVDVINSGQSPALNPKVEVIIDLEPAWFGGSFVGTKAVMRNIAPHVGIKDKIQPAETSRFYFAWTQPELEDIFDLLNDERNTVVLTCKLSSATIYPKTFDRGVWQLTNYPGFVRSTDRSRVAEGKLYPRQLQKRK